jgi:AMMECR1 domain-containing protein
MESKAEIQDDIDRMIMLQRLEDCSPKQWHYYVSAMETASENPRFKHLSESELSYIMMDVARKMEKVHKKKKKLKRYIKR